MRVALNIEVDAEGRKSLTVNRGNYSNFEPGKLSLFSDDCQSVEYNLTLDYSP